MQKITSKINSGIYILEIECSRQTVINHKKFRTFLFQPGKYFYVGSAQRNLQARINRHFAVNKPLRWHIDYITTNPAFSVSGVNIFELGKEYECEIVNILLKTGNFLHPLRKFGNSDCTLCESHLLMSKDKRSKLSQILAFLNQNSLIINQNV